MKLNFFKLKDTVKSKSWKDVTLKQYYQIRDTMIAQDEYTAFNLIDIIYGIDSQSLTINKITPYLRTLDFLKDEPAVVPLKKKYNINGTVYCVDIALPNVTTGQFVDWRNYLNRGDAQDKMENILSVFFIPEGHNYGDGYDITKVQEDLLCLDYQTIYSASFFFKKQLEILSKTFQRSLRKRVKTMKNKTEREQFLEIADALDLPSMISCLISSSTANLQMRSLQTRSDIQ